MPHFCASIYKSRRVLDISWAPAGNLWEFFQGEAPTPHSQVSPGHRLLFSPVRWRQCGPSASHSCSSRCPDHPRSAVCSFCVRAFLPRPGPRHRLPCLSPRPELVYSPQIPAPRLSWTHPPSPAPCWWRAGRPCHLCSHGFPTPRSLFSLIVLSGGLQAHPSRVSP